MALLDRLSDPAFQGLLGMGMGLLGGSGWSPTPVSFGQALAAGGNAGLNAFNAARQQKQQEKQAEMQQQMMQEELAGKKRMAESFAKFQQALSPPSQPPSSPISPAPADSIASMQLPPSPLMTPAAPFMAGLLSPPDQSPVQTPAAHPPPSIPDFDRMQQAAMGLLGSPETVHFGQSLLTIGEKEAKRAALKNIFPSGSSPTADELMKKGIELQDPSLVHYGEFIEREGDRKRQAQEKMGNKNEATLDKMEQQLRDSLDPDKARAGNLAQNQARRYQAERLQTLITDSGGNLRNLDPRQMEELAIGLQRLLGSGQGSAEQVKALVPRTAIGSAQKLKEWLMNNPTGTNQLAFVQRMAETVEREKNLSMQQVLNSQLARLPSYYKLRIQRPNRYKEILMGFGIDPENIKNGKYQLPTPKVEGKTLSDEDREAINWAKSNPQDPRAKQILSLHGGL